MADLNPASPAIAPGERPRVSFWNDPKVRSYAVQTLLALLFLVGLFTIVQNTASNLVSRHISSGFSFLYKNAGFDIAMSLIQYSSNSTYLRAIVAGLLNTLLIAFLGIIFATIVGFIVGIMRLSRNWLIARIGTVYVEVIRNVPLLLQMYVWYQAVLKPLPGPRQAVNVFNMFFLSNRGLSMPAPVFGPGAWLGLAGLVLGIIGAIVVHRWAKRRQAVTGQHFPSVWAGIALIIGLPVLGLLLAGWPLTFDIPKLGGFNFRGGATIIPEFMALWLAISIYTGSFIAEVVRSGILAVSHGQTEAAGALGLRSGPTMRLVVIPQALRVIIPPLASQYLNLTKNSSLAVAIGYPDLVATGGTVMNQTGQAVEVVTIWMVVYLGLSLSTSAFMNWFNSRVRLVER